MTSAQQTIREPVSLSGRGLHTGLDCTITFKPAPINHGVVFRLLDTEGPVEIKADIDNVVELTRGTTLGKNGHRVYTVEHVMAAVAGLEIDNLIIELTGKEPPAADG